ncbi:MAG: hypothetical protein ACRD0B_06060, partial [Acidimicrobiales bacterium]
EVRLCLEGAAVVAERHSTRDQTRIWNNLAWFYATHDLKGAEERAIEALDLVRRRGRRSQEAVFADTLMLPLRLAGRLEEAERVGDDVLGSVTSEIEGSSAICCQLALIAAMRGRTDRARERLERAAALESSSSAEMRATFAMGRSIVELEEGDPRAALEAALRAIGDGLTSSGPAADPVRECIPIAVDAALSLGAPGEVEPVVAELSSRPPGELPPFVRAQLRRARILLAAAGRAGSGADADLPAVDVERELSAVIAAFTELSYPYWVGRAELDLAEWLATEGRTGEAAGHAGEAARIFDELGTPSMMARADAIGTPPASAPTPADSPRLAESAVRPR